jgi:hypothetical protein
MTSRKDSPCHHDRLKTIEEHNAALFHPLTLRALTVRNRPWIAPICQYSVFAEDGIRTDWHLAHPGQFAIGGTGMVLTDATAVTPGALSRRLRAAGRLPVRRTSRPAASPHRWPWTRAAPIASPGRSPTPPPARERQDSLLRVVEAVRAVLDDTVLLRTSGCRDGRPRGTPRSALGSSCGRDERHRRPRPASVSARPVPGRTFC